MNTAVLFVSNITSVSEPDQHGVRTMVANVAYNGTVKSQVCFPITVDSYTSVMKHGFFPAAVV